MATNSVYYNDESSQQQAIIGVGPGAAVETTQALNTAYTYATGGIAFASLFIAQETANLTDFYVKVMSYTGTWASTDGVINVQIREGNNGNNIPGTTLTGSFTMTLDGSTTGWIAKTGLSIGLTQGKQYCIVVGDADGGAVNFVTLSQRFSVGPLTSAFVALSLTTANGYSTAGTNTQAATSFVFKVGSQLYGGAGLATRVTVTTGTYERGMRFKPTDDCTLVGLVYVIDQQIIVAGHTYKLYADATAVGGTTLMTYTPAATTFSGTSPVASMMPLPAASQVDLTGGTWYRFTILPNASLTVPGKCTIGGSPDTNVINALMPFGAAHWIDSSSGSWDDTQTTSLPSMGIVVVPRSGSGTTTNVFSTMD